MLQNTRIILRSIEEKDKETFKKWYNDYEITRVVSFAEYTPRSSYEEEVWVRSKILDKKSRYFIITFQDNDIGYMAYSNLDFKNGNVELSIVIGEKEYRGKRVGLEVLNLFEQYLQDELNVRKINVKVLEGNQQSLGLFNKNGYIEQGRMVKEVFKEGRYKDIILLYKFLR